MGELVRHGEFPRGAVWAAACLLALSMTGVLFSRVTGAGATRLPAVPAAEIRTLVFSDRADGAIVVRPVDGLGAEVIVAPGGDGFVRGVLRGLARERKRRASSPLAPFELIRYADGRLAVDDPQTGRSVDLGAFGATNYGAFRRLFEATAPDQALAVLGPRHIKQGETR